MLVQCTSKLLQELQIRPTPAADCDPLFCWHANITLVNRKKLLFLVNDSNQYVIVLYGLKKKHLDHLDKLINDAIRRVFAAEMIDTGIIDAYLEKASDIAYSRTRDRTSVARLNRSGQNIINTYSGFDTSDIIQEKASMRTSSYVVGIGQNKSTIPCDRLYADLAEYFGKPVFQLPAAELKITLQLEEHSAWRQVIVPVGISFYQLHLVIQKLFNWEDYHLHEFVIPGNRKPVVQIACLADDEYLEDIAAKAPVVRDRDTFLFQYFPKYKQAVYDYDFGDGWGHTIKLVRMIDSFNQNYPELTGGAGRTPPEDVGGIGGYFEYLDAITNADHPEHETMLEWGGWPEFKKYSPLMLKSRLKNVLKDFVIDM